MNSPGARLKACTRKPATRPKSSTLSSFSAALLLMISTAWSALDTATLLRVGLQPFGRAVFRISRASGKSKNDASFVPPKPPRRISKIYLRRGVQDLFAIVIIVKPAVAATQPGGLMPSQRVGQNEIFAFK